MLEEKSVGDRDLRAARFLAALIDGRGITPEELADRTGVGASTVRNALRGVIPHKSTQARVARYFEMDQRDIWRRARAQRQRRRPPSQKALAAMSVAVEDPHTLRARMDLPDGSDFAYGVAWAVVRAGAPYASPDVVAERAAAATLKFLGTAMEVA